jgi:hypothetical protein
MQGPSVTGRKDRRKTDKPPQTPGYDKKLDGPNRPST